MKKYLTEVLLITKTTNLQDFKDWLHYHLDVINFQHAHIMDNESQVDIKMICDSYGDRVSYEKIIGLPCQYDNYNRYINNESKAWWVLPIDDDEYLWMKNYNNVNDMIMDYSEKWPDMNKLSIRWKNMFPDDPHAKRENKSLMEFCKNDNPVWAELFDGGNKPVKTFVKTTIPVNHTIKIGNQTHNPITDGSKSYMCNGDRLYGNWYYGSGDDDLKLLHYQYKSEDEWNWKCLNRIAGGTDGHLYGGLIYKRFYGISEKMK